MEFSAGIGSQGAPSAIAKGPDGNLWFTARKNGAPGTIGRISPLGVVTEFAAGPEKDARPNAIASGPDGNLWFTDPGNDSIGRMTPQGAVTRFSVARPGGRLESIAAGPDGNLWFTDSGFPARIGRITPAGAVTSFTEGINPNGRLAGIAPGSDGNLWFAERGAGGGIGRITPDGAITEFAAGLTPDAKPFGIAAAFDGNMWFTVDDNPDAVGRISSAGDVRLFRSGLQPTARPEGIALGPDAAMWFAESGTGMIGRVEPATAEAAEEASARGNGKVRLPPGTAPPAVGRSVVVEVTSGRVLMRLPNGRIAALGPGATVPVNTVLDTRAGGLRLSAALPGAERFQSAQLWGGRFVVRQMRDGMTDIQVIDLPQGCSRRGRLAGKAAWGRRPGLWVRDRRGRFRTRGRNSVATVRGTSWRTTETCSGTVTFVTEGAVSVYDRRLRRSVLVRAGHSYLARNR